MVGAAVARAVEGALGGDGDREARLELHDRRVDLGRFEAAVGGRAVGADEEIAKREAVGAARRGCGAQASIAAEIGELDGVVADPRGGADLEERAAAAGAAADREDGQVDVAQRPRRGEARRPTAR